MPPAGDPFGRSACTGGSVDPYVEEDQEAQGASAALQGQPRQASQHGSRVTGAHLYGPWFRPEAKGCHPGQGLRDATEEQVRPYLEYAADKA